MEEILLNGENILHKTTYISNAPKKELVIILENEIKKLPSIINEAFSISPKTEGLKDIIDFGVTCCEELAIKDKLIYNDIWVDIWINRIKHKDAYQKVTTNIEDANYHIHTDLSKEYQKFIPNYTFVYYVQMPNNLSGNEGALLVKNTKNDVYIYHPKETDFIIMKANTPHSPMASSNSTIDRLVVAGNIGFLNIKKEKSLF